MFIKLQIHFWQVTNKRQPSQPVKGRPDVDSHKQWLIVQRARKAVAVKGVMEHTARSFLSERQKGEKPDLLSKTFFFSALKMTHYMAQ